METDLEKTVIIGGGAAGMMAAIRYAQRGFDVTLLEQNEKLGKKIFITGKGRCNLTNDCDEETFFSSMISNPKFLFSSYAACTAQDVMRLFESWGLEIKVERGRRVFPVSDHSYDVIDALKLTMKKLGVKVLLNTKAEALLTEDLPEEPTEDGKKKKGPTMRITGVKAGGRVYPADRVLVATGGLSYPSTGSRGDGHRMAEATGHRVTACRPSLVAITCGDVDLKPLQGLSLKNVTLSVYRGKKVVYSDFGEMLFTHFGVSGPLVLTAGARIGDDFKKGPVKATIDLKPTVDEQRLDEDLVRLFEEHANKDAVHAIRSLYPASMVNVLLDRAGIPLNKKAHDITKAERAALRSATKAFTLNMTGLRGFEEAIVTHGGVSVKDVDPATMASKKVKGLYFAGEVLDLDAVTGGFNLQIAWSTGWAAGSAE
ncbi:MAG: NAD(P)/FAD-dependent oxidoreductase [Lachnospiraceae bacterium]|nr:NAD(P)/FAD-dependent oxidoreductase [Lachnospiraceae bacterium]